MKRTIAAVSLAMLSASVLAAEVSAPYEKTQFDRGLYNVEQSASSGQTMTNAGSSVWANDHNFIAPAQ